MITQKELKELLHYDPETGVFTWVTSRVGVKAGTVAGCLRTSGYRAIGVDSITYLAHRLAWLYIKGYWPDEIDHENQIKTDNRWVNLREATRQENQRNHPRRKDNTSGVIGVCWSKVSKEWRSYIRINGSQEYLGLFVDKFEAICARKSAEAKYGFHPNHGR